MWGWQLESRCYLIDKLRYRTLHLYFRLMVAMFGSPVTSTSESFQLCHNMLLYLKNIGTRRNFGYITFELRHPVHIWMPPFWMFVGVAQNITMFKISGKCACDSLSIGETACKNSYPFRRYRRVQLLHPSRHLRNQKTSAIGGLMSWSTANTDAVYTWLPIPALSPRPQAIRTHAAVTVSSPPTDRLDGKSSSSLTTTHTDLRDVTNNYNNNNNK